MVSLSLAHRAHTPERCRKARPTKASRQDRRRLLSSSGGLLLAFAPAPGERAWIRVGTDGSIAVLRESAVVDENLSELAAAQLLEERAAAPERSAPLRVASATAREMLIAAAAQVWSVPVSACRAARGVVVNTQTDAQLPIGKLAPLAALLPVPFFLLR